MKKRIFLTLDFEEDLGTASTDRTYYCHEYSDEFINYIIDNNLNSTLFVTGEILDKKSFLLDSYLKNKSYFQFEYHSYNHEDAFSHTTKRIENINKGLEVYKNYFGTSPKVYRAPNGMIGIDEAKYLSDSEIKYSSSIFPTFFPGRFYNLRKPRTPISILDHDLIEIPFSVTKFLRIPISLSYIQLLGFDYFRKLLEVDDSRDIIFDFHLHDLYLFNCAGKLDLSSFYKLVYRKVFDRNYSLGVFDKVVHFFKNKGYSFCLLDDLLDEFTQCKPKCYQIDKIYS